MKFQWIRKHVNLELLAEKIENFFVTNGFKISKEVSGSQVSFVAAKKYDELSLTILITLYVKSDNIVINLTPMTSELTLVFNQFLRMLGLGFFVLKDIKLREIYDKIERDFVSYIEKGINDLVA